MARPPRALWNKNSSSWTNPDNYDYKAIGPGYKWWNLSASSGARPGRRHHHHRSVVAPYTGVVRKFDVAKVRLVYRWAVLGYAQQRRLEWSISAVSSGLQPHLAVIGAGYEIAPAGKPAAPSSTAATRSGAIALRLLESRERAGAWASSRRPRAIRQRASPRGMRLLERHAECHPPRGGVPVVSERLLEPILSLARRARAPTSAWAA